MSKRRNATRGGIEHGVVSHATHQRDKKAFEKRRGARKQKVFVAVGIAEPGTEYPAFQSDLSALGTGANWLVGKRSGSPLLTECGGDRWIELMSRIRSWADHYHQRQVRSVEIKVSPERGARARHTTTKKVRQVGYYRRKIKDRVTLGPTDKHARKESDLMRETIDLRPDHSRALQYMLENLEKRDAVEDALAEIRQEKIRLFEEIYGRRVVGVGEHPDSGQYHNDLWHKGIRSDLVTDSGALVEGKDGSRLTGGKSKKVRLRTEFRQFGVSVGVASWDRHRSALEEFGADARSLMSEEMKIIERNTETAEKQNGELPRDLRLLNRLDAFVRERLEKIDINLYRHANEDYVRWLEGGYRQGKLGLMGRSQRVEKLEMELAELRAQARVDGEHRLEMNTRIAKLEGEVDGLREELAREKSAKEDLAKDLETARNMSVHQMEILNNRYQGAKTERDGFKGQVEELKHELLQDKTAKRDLEKEYSKVCEERNRLQIEKDGVETDLEDLRGMYAESKSKLAKRDALIDDLQKENRKLRFMESKFDALAEVVRVFCVKLLGRRAIKDEIRYDKPLSGAFGAMFHHATGMSVEEFRQNIEAPPKSGPLRGHNEPSKDNGLADPEDP